MTPVPIPKLSRRRVLLIPLAMAMMPIGASARASLPRPTGRVLLTATGSIDQTNADGKAEFDLAMLEQIGTSRLQTSTPWTDGRPVFEGVLMRNLMARLGARGETVTVVALNEYKMQIPTADFGKYPVLLAFKMNGETLRVRDKGPLWLVYPQDEFPELQNKPTQAKWVWQIKEMRFE
jgi:hypothetical protein